MRKIDCPTCGVVKLEPKWPSSKTVTWTDECACSSYGYCVYHRYNDDRPKEPSDDSLTARAQAKFDSDVTKFEDYEQSFDAVRAYLDLAPDIADLITDLKKLLNRVSGHHKVDDMMISLGRAEIVVKSVLKTRI